MIVRKEITPEVDEIETDDIIAVMAEEDRVEVEVALIIEDHVVEVEPAGYAALAANEAEKAAKINILEVLAFGSFGRVYLGGEERDIMAGYGAAVAAIEGVSGREIETKRRV